MQKKPFFVFTDASDLALGAVLTQLEGDTYLSIEYVSRKFGKAELNYSTYKKEVLAVIYGLRQFRHYVLDREFTVFTDNSAVSFIFNQTIPNGRRLRWRYKLMEYSFTFRHLPRKLNAVADGLSRIENNPAEYATFLSELPDLEPELVKIWQFLETFNVLEGTTDSRAFKLQCRKFLVFQGKLYLQTNVALAEVVPRGHRSQRLRKAHDDNGHFEQRATWERLFGRFWWPTAYADTVNYVLSCHPCQIFAPPLRKQKPVYPITTKQLFDLWGIDFVGPLRATDKGNRYIIVASEYFSRWPLAKAVEKADALTASTFLYEEILTTFGPPGAILTDRGAHFKNKLMRCMVRQVRTRHFFTTAYNPQCNGQTERLNQTLVHALERTTTANPEKWDKSSFRFCGHTVPSSTTPPRVPPMSSCSDGNTTPPTLYNA